MTIMILCVWHRSSSALLIMSHTDRGKGREYRVRRPPTNVFLQLSSSQNIRISQNVRISRNVRILEYPRISEYLRILYVHHPMCFFNSPHLTLYHLRLKWSTPSIYKLIWSQLFDSKDWSMIISNEKSSLNTKEHHFNGVTCSFFL